MMADSDTVFVDCNDGEVNDRESSVEVLNSSSGNGESNAGQKESGERDDIVQAYEALRGVKASIQYPDDESLQEALDKIKERPRIDAEFQEKISILQRIKRTENYSSFHGVVEQGLRQLTEAQERASKGKTSLSRPIEILNEVLPVFEKACAVYTEKVEASNQVNMSLREVEGIRLELKQCERLDTGDVDKAKKLERKGDKILEEAVRHSNDDVERIKRKITEEEQAGILTYFENTRKETNDRMEFLTNDFEKMKNNCAEDIQLTDRTLEIQIANKEGAHLKFQKKDEELGEEIQVKMEQEEELKRQLEEVRAERTALEEDRECRRAMQDKADVVHEKTEDELKQLLINLNDLLAKVDTANVVLKQTKNVCNMLFKKAVESKNMQNQDMEDVLLLTKKNRHNALIAQGVNCMVIQERESGAMDILKDKIKKKKEKLHDSLKHRLANDAKKLTEKIKAINGEIETSKKTYEKASEKLVNLKQQILDVQGDLDSARISYSTLEQKYAEFRKIDEGDDGCSLTSMPSIS